MSEEAQFIYDELRKEGFSLFIKKHQYAKIQGCSVSTVDNRLKAGFGLPNYKRMNDSKNGMILFNLRDVAEFIAGRTVKTA